MKKRIHDSINNEKGFTLVELAVVMVIIGLLVGGILKGQEMIANAQVTSTVAQLKSIDAATGTFRDIYDAFPGDMAGAENRLPNCTVASGCAPAASDGDTRLETAPLAAVAADEELAFFLQIEAADLVSGVNPAGLMDAKITGNEITPSFSDGTAFGLLTGPRSGHYLSIVQAGTAAGLGLKPIDAARMDRKMDDGDPSAGAAGAAGADCDDAAGTGYGEATQSLECTFSIRIQG